MSSSFQQTLFEYILKQYPKKAEAVEVMSKVLSMAKDNVYRRIRGETILTPDEIVSLTKHYNLSLDELIYGDSEKILFSFTPFSNQLKNFHDWLELTYENLKTVHQIPDAIIYYAAQEIPIHLYFQFPKLLNFRAYLLNLMSKLDFGHASDLSFSFNLLPNETLELAAKFAKLYTTVPSIEMWNLGILDNTLSSIEYLSTIEKFEDPNTALELCEELVALLVYTKDIAANGAKYIVKGDANAPGASFELYHNELIDTNNSIYVSSSFGNQLFTTFGNPNFLSTNDKKLCAYTEDWFNSVIEKSTSISKHSIRSRNWYFNKLEKRIAQTKTKIAHLIEEM